MFYNIFLSILFHRNIFKETFIIPFHLLRYKLKSIFIYL